MTALKPWKIIFAYILVGTLCLGMAIWTYLLSMDKWYAWHTSWFIMTLSIFLFALLVELSTNILVDYIIPAGIQPDVQYAMHKLCQAISATSEEVPLPHVFSASDYTFASVLMSKANSHAVESKVIVSYRIDTPDTSAARLYDHLHLKSGSFTGLLHKLITEIYILFIRLPYYFQTVASYFILCVFGSAILYVFKDNLFAPIILIGCMMLIGFLALVICLTYAPSTGHVQHKVIPASHHHSHQVAPITKDEELGMSTFMLVDIPETEDDFEAFNLALDEMEDDIRPMSGLSGVSGVSNLSRSISSVSRVASGVNRGANAFKRGLARTPSSWVPMSPAIPSSPSGTLSDIEESKRNQLLSQENQSAINNMRNILERSTAINSAVGKFKGSLGTARQTTNNDMPSSVSTEMMRESPRKPKMAKIARNTLLVTRAAQRLKDKVPKFSSFKDDDNNDNDDEDHGGDESDTYEEEDLYNDEDGNSNNYSSSAKQDALSPAEALVFGDGSPSTINNNPRFSKIVARTTKVGDLIKKIQNSRQIATKPKNKMDSESTSRSNSSTKKSKKKKNQIPRQSVIKESVFEDSESDEEEG